MPVLAFAVAALGAGWGAIADRIAARWPEHEAELDEAGTVLRAAGWRRAVDWRTAATIGFGAAVLAGVAWRFTGLPELLVFGAWAVVVTVLFATDLDQRLLPDVLTLPLVVAAAVLVLAGLDPFVVPADLPLAALAAVLVPALLFALSIPFGAGAFGLGDVKFLLGFGLLAGPSRLLIGVVVGVLLAGAVILVLLALRRISLRSFIPYGPFLIVGAAWALLGTPAG